MSNNDQNEQVDQCHESKHSNDNREFGHIKTRFQFWSWVQITIELTVLIVYALVGIVGVAISIQTSQMDAVQLAKLPRYSTSIASLNPWSGMFFAAMAGGTTFALKWLYHSVAKFEWNQDRILWRFIVPLNSSILATCSGFGIAAGIMPFLDQNSFGNLYTALFFGFFIGHFSDNVLAGLQRLARKWFGTVDG